MNKSLIFLIPLFQWGSCYSIFSVMCMFCRSLFVFSEVRVTRSLVLCVCFVDRCLFLVGFVLLDLKFYVYVLQTVVCFQWGLCYSILSFMCMFCRSLFVFSGFVLLDLQFYVYVLQIVVCFQWCTCYSIFSFMCMFCRPLFVLFLMAIVLSVLGFMDCD